MQQTGKYIHVYNEHARKEMQMSVLEFAQDESGNNVTK